MWVQDCGNSTVFELRYVAWRKTYGYAVTFVCYVTTVNYKFSLFFRVTALQWDKHVIAPVSVK